MTIGVLQQEQIVDHLVAVGAQVAVDQIDLTRTIGVVDPFEDDLSEVLAKDR